MTATGGVVKATLTGSISLESKAESESTLSPNNSFTTTLPAVLSAEGSIKAPNAVDLSFSRKEKVLKLSAKANISYKNLKFATYRLGSLKEIATNVYETLNNFEASLESTLSPTYLDKFAGNFGDFECLEKLYPSGDLTTDSSMGKFVGSFLESGNLYTLIDFWL